MELSKNIMVEPSTEKRASRNPFVTLLGRNFNFSNSLVPQPVSLV